MANQNDKNDLPAELQKRYGAYKVSEFTHGKKGYEFEDKKAEPTFDRPDEEYLKALQDEDVDYKKRYTLSEKNKSFEQEYKSAKDVFKEFSPRQWKNQVNYI